MATLRPVWVPMCLVYHEEIIVNGFKYLLAGDQVEFFVKEKPRGPMALEVARTKR
jgi:cold shock CspA family protein